MVAVPPMPTATHSSTTHASDSSECPSVLHRPATARQQKAADTRARLFAAAAELFARNGYHATTVDQIAKHAGVAKGTFFVHFATKDAVITQLVRGQTKAATRERERVRAAGGSSVERLRAAVMMLGRQAATSRRLSRAVLAASLESPEIGGATDALFLDVFNEMVEDVKSAQAEGLLRPQPDAETLAGVLMASYLGAALHFTSAPRAKPLLDVLEPLIDANLAAFALSEGKEPEKTP